MSRHECKYWKVNAKWRYRDCGFCGRIQYNYTGEWKDKISLETFVSRWTGGMGGTCNDYTPYLRIEVSLPFEEKSYEAWDDMYSITFLQGEYAGKTFKWYFDLNHADYELRKAGLIPPWEKVSAKSSDSDAGRGPSD